MNQLIHDRQIRKRYWAIVKNPPTVQKDTLVHYLLKDERKNKVFVSKEPKDGFLRAELNYEIIASSDSYHLLDVNLITGRHHQIRAQLAAIGSPIRGDVKYGFIRPNLDASISLHARSISFIHPITLQTTLITAGTPNERLWHCFKEKLKIPE
jgi:23S rRNA pseudouridine1911/1915/1917 synthase